MTTNTDHPTLGLILRDMADADEMQWRVEFDIKADKDYSWPYIYKADCPIDLPSDHADFKTLGKTIPMPTAMHTLWYLKALYRCQRAFRKDDAWKDTVAEYARELKRARAEKDAPSTSNIEPLADGYQDVDATLGRGDLAASNRGRLADT